ncbi:beta-ketoacyl-[acyl-carrier-protein] synthase family protein, partial [Motilibacter sp. E257]|nr:beta-ketoacyl-[acyl-carrier-protein] synthase family protein [Motilibacter deserti]
MARRVVITGVGPLAGVAAGARAYSAALQAGASAIAPIRSFDPAGFPHHMAGELTGFDPTEYLRRLDAEQWGPASQFAAAAAR